MKKQTLLLVLTLLLSLLCVNHAAATIYLSEDFENIPADAKIPQGWDNQMHTNVTDIEYRWGINSKGFVGNGLMFNSYFLHRGSYNTLYSSQIFLPQTSDAQVDFMFKNPKGGDCYLCVLKSDNNVDTLSSNLISILDWTKYSFSLSKYAGQTIRLAWYSVSNYAMGDAYHYLDNVVVQEKPICARPIKLNLVSISQTSATISWSLDYAEVNPDKYHIEVFNSLGTKIKDYDFNTLGFSTIIDGLEPSSTYSAYLTGNCISQDKGYSDKSEGISFSTLLNPITLPYSLNFEKSNLPIGVLSDGYVDVNNYMAYGNSSYSVKLQSTKENSAMLILPQMAHPANDVEFSAMVRSSKDNAKFFVGLMSDPSNPSTFEIIREDSISNSGVWVDYRINTSMYALTDQGMSVAIMLPNGLSSTVYFDNIEIRKIPSCPRPERLSIVNLDSVSVTIDYDGKLSVANRQLELLEGDASVYQLVDDKPSKLNNLKSNTTYKVRLRDICAVGDTSEWSSYLTFTTECSPVVANGFMEDFENVSYLLPLCWTQRQVVKGNGYLDYGDKAWEISSYRANTGSHAIKMKESSIGTHTLLISAPIYIEEAGKYDLSFYFYRTERAPLGEGVSIWLNNSPDTVGGTKCGFINSRYSYEPVNDVAGYVKYEYNIDKKGAVYIIFDGITQASEDLFIDDVSVSLAPTCRRLPKNSISVESSSTNSARMVWPSVGDKVMSYIVAYKLNAYGNNDILDTICVEHNYLDLLDLSAMTHYEVSGSIAKICNVGDTSEWSSFFTTFNTADTILEVPFIQTFNDKYFPPVGWSVSDSEMWTRTLSANSAVASMSGSARKTSLMVSPKLNFKKGSYDLNFKMKRRNSVGFNDTIEGFKFYINSVPNLNGAISLDRFYSNKTFVPEERSEGFYEYNVLLGEQTGDKYLIIEGYADGKSSNYIDDLAIIESPTCRKFKWFTIDSIFSSSVVISIPDVCTWEVEYGLSGFTIGNGSKKVFSNSSIGKLEGLNSNTKYDFYVRKVCSSVDTSALIYSYPLSITTLCAPFEVSSSNEYFEDFESYKEGDTIFGCFIRSTEELLVKPSVATAFSHDVRAYGGNIFSYQQYDYNAWSFVALYLKKGVNYEISGWFNHDNLASSKTTQVSLGISSEPTYQKCTILKAQYINTNGWEQVLSYFTVPSDGVYYAGWKIKQNSAPWLSAMDNLRVREVSCIPPISSVVSSVSSDTAKIEWVSNASQWELLVTDADTAISHNVVFRDTLSESYCVLRNLESNKDYYYYLRSICEGGYSDWTDVSLFQTLCSEVSMPYIINFEEKESSLTELRCWNLLGSGGTVSRDISNGHSSSASLKLQKATWVSPQFAVDSLSNYMVSGWAFASTDSVAFSIGVMLDINDINTYEELGSVLIPKAKTWTEFTVYFNNLKLPDYESFSSAKHIVFGVNEKRSILYLDDIIFDSISSCPKPTEVLISEVTPFSFKLGWRQNGSETRWRAVVSSGEVIVKDTILTVNPSVINGLSPVTEYHISLRGICGVNDTSEVSNCGTIITDCASYALPYKLDIPHDRNVDLPNCWSIGHSNCSPTMNWKVTKSEDGQWVLFAGPYDYYGTSFKSILHSPLFDLSDVFTPKLEIDIKNMEADTTFIMLQKEGVIEYDTLGIFLGNAIAQPARDTLVYDLSNYIGNRIVVAIEGRSTNSYYSGGTTIYSMRVDAEKGCSRPQLFDIISVADTTIGISIFDSIGEHNKWQVVCAPAGVQPQYATPISTINKEFDFVGLSPATRYDVYVRTVCADGDYSLWSEPQSIITLCSSKVLPYEESFENCSDLSELCFDFHGVASNGEYPYVNLGYASLDPDYVNHGHQSLILTSDHINNLYLMLPSFGESLGSLNLTFDYRNQGVTGSNGFVIVGYVTSRTDISTFKAVMTCPLTKTFKRVSIDFDTIVPAGVDGDIVLMYDGRSTGFMCAIDNIKVSSIGNCPKINGIELVGRTHNSLELNLSGRTLSKVEIAYDSENKHPNLCANKKVVNSNVVLLSDLTASTTYNIYARSICNDIDTSAWSEPICYSTLCDDFVLSKKMEYYEDFENLSSMSVKFPTCVTPLEKSCVGTDVYPLVSEQSALNGNYGMIMKGLNMIVLPKFNYRSDRLILSVTAKGSDFKVGVADILVADSVHEVANISNSTSVAKNYEIELFGANVSGDYIVIYTFYNTAQLSIDDIVVRVKPDCHEPRNFVFQELLDTTLKLSWNAGDSASIYQYRFIDYNKYPFDTIFNVVDTNVLSLAGLKSSGQYSVSVRSICGIGDTTSWSESVLVKTLPKLAVVPYSFTFDSVEENNNWVFINGNYTDRFTFGKDVSGVKNGDCALYVSNGAVYKYDGPFYNYDPYSGMGSHLVESFYVYRTFYLNKGHYDISYLWKAQGVQSSSGKYQYNYGRIFLMPAGDELYVGSNSFETKYKMLSERLLGMSEWCEGVSSFNVSNDGLYNLVIAWYQSDDARGSTPLSVDSISISQSICAGIEDVKLVNLSSISAEFNVNNSNNCGNIEYYLTSNDQLICDTMSLSFDQSNIVINNLMANTPYSFYIRANCNEYLKSNWFKVDFATHCSPDTITQSNPFVDSFEFGYNNYSKLSSCWLEESVKGSSEFIVNTQESDKNRFAYDGTNFVTLMYGNESTFYRDFYLEKGKSYNVSIWSIIDAPHKDCSISILSKINGVDTLLATEILTNEYSKTWTKYTANWTGLHTLGVNVSLSDMAWYASLDLFEIYEAVIDQPIGLNLLEVSSNYALVGWKACEDSCQLQVFDKQNIVFDTIVPKGVSNCTIPNLMPNVNYKVRLRAVDALVKSTWSPYLNVFTPCSVSSVPYVQDFSNVTDNKLVPCWDAESGTISENSKRWGVYNEDGNNSLRLNTSFAKGLNVVKTEAFYIHADNFELTFDYEVYSLSDSLQVYLSADAGRTFTDTVLSSKSNILTQSVVYSLSKYVGDTIVLAFCCDASYSSVSYYIDVDNFSISCVDEVIISDTICYGTTYLLHGFNIPAGQLVESGLHKFSRYDISTNPNTCNTMTYLNLYVRPNNSQLLYDTICEGDVYVSEAFPNGLSLGGKYIKTMTGVNGCDSLITLFLTVANPRYDYSYSICDGDTYNFNGMLLTDNGVYRDTIIRTGKCDSIVTLNLKVLPTKFHTDKTVCDGEEYIWLDTVVATSGVYVRRYKNHIGCDSVHTLNFTVLPSEVSIDSTICHGQLVKLGTNVYSESGDYSVLFENSLGCDSVVNLHLTVLEPDTIDVADQVCEGYKYSGYGYVDVDLTSDTILQNVQKDADGCEMVQRLYIDFIPTITVDTMVSISDGETYLFCGNSLSKSGTYDCTLRSESTGCDSVVHLTLVVTTGVDNVYTLPLVIAPNPVDRGREVVIYQELTSEEQEGVRVEVLDALGRMIQHFVPDSYPIKVSAFDVSGVYTIRIVTGTDKVYIGRLVVR